MIFNQVGILLQTLAFVDVCCQLPFPTPLDCSYITHEPCLLYGPGVTCGSDGKDYINSCRLAQAMCLNPFITLIGDGRCADIGYTRPSITNRPTTQSNTEITTSHRTSFTTLPTSGLTSSDPLGVICSTIGNVRCANDIEPVCGSDERTYINNCEFHKEVCQKHDLTVKHIGFC
ncbi:tomoregulin-2-like [Mercenaria mercenaria]|uniref:tomoregulin-2-like n=1 Tax=Mercenaria mercenaria TaxID=6596 RepID=UPI00234ECA25|nr:tomoregulin-2-like [Mercenaria mercenaria]